jgi:PEGA domain-containing protein
MKIVKELTVMTLVFAMASVPAFAERRETGNRNADSGRAAERAVPRPGAARTVTPSASTRTVVTAPGYHAVHPVAAAPHAVVVGHAVPRAYVPYHGPYHAPYYAPYHAVAPVTFYRPYYTFRPHVHVAFGVWLGYPIVYAAPYYVPYYAPDAYPAPYPYPPAPYPYPPSAYPQSAPPAYPQSAPPAYPPYQQPYPPSSTPPTSYPSPSAAGSVTVQANMGGLSFQITPQAADIFIDGGFVGNVGQFTPQSQPLGVPAGHHRVEIRSEGFRPMAFDVDVVAGQVLPYQGTMQRS